mgnify:CR=1 FL=1
MHSGRFVAWQNHVRKKLHQHFFHFIATAAMYCILTSKWKLSKEFQASLLWRWRKNAWMKNPDPIFTPRNCIRPMCLYLNFCFMSFPLFCQSYVCKYLHCKPIPVMKTGFSLCTFPNREKPVFIAGIPANVNRFFPVWEKYTGKSLFWPCTGSVRDCIAVILR